MVTDLSVDLFDPAFYTGDPFPTYAELRRDAPVCWHEGAGLWSVARHADVMTVSRDPKTFCSGKGVLANDRGRPIAGSDSIIYLDPPDHHRYRKLVSSGFTPRRIAALESRVRELAAELLEGVEAGRPFDLVEQLSAPLPLLVIAELLGIPFDDRDRFKTWSDAVIDAADEPGEETFTIAAELWQYFEGVIDERRRSPSGDLISVVATAEVDGELLTDLELNGFCMTLLVAGNETTRNLISGGVQALTEHPDQLAALAADPTLVPAAVEEMLRWVTPVLSFARTATRDVELGGQQVGAGDYVLMLYQSANRDEETFGPTAERFDIGRTPNPHVAFGFGEHFCLGASLARLEARIVFDELLRRFSTIELAGDPEWLGSTLMHSIVRLPVMLER